MEGLAEKQKERAADEENREPGYRGGNSGVRFEDGLSAGECPRKVLARYLGWSENHSPSKQLMFKAGERNEDTWMEFLTKSKYEGDIEKCDNFTAWKTEAGTPVTGSPGEMP